VAFVIISIASPAFTAQMTQAMVLLLNATMEPIASLAASGEPVVTMAVK